MHSFYYSDVKFLHVCSYQEPYQNQLQLAGCLKRRYVRIRTRKRVVISHTWVTPTTPSAGKENRVNNLRSELINGHPSRSILALYSERRYYPGIYTGKNTKDVRHHHTTIAINILAPHGQYTVMDRKWQKIMCTVIPRLFLALRQFIYGIRFTVYWHMAYLHSQLSTAKNHIYIFLLFNKSTNHEQKNSASLRPDQVPSPEYKSELLLLALSVCDREHVTCTASTMLTIQILCNQNVLSGN